MNYHPPLSPQFAATKKKVADKSLSEEEREQAVQRIERLKRTEWLCEYMVKGEVWHTHTHIKSMLHHFQKTTKVALRVYKVKLFFF